MYHQVLTLKNPTYFQQSIYMCFKWISKQRAFTSVDEINESVFIMNTHCVLCEVNTYRVRFRLGVIFKDLIN